MLLFPCPASSPWGVFPYFFLFVCLVVLRFVVGFAGFFCLLFVCFVCFFCLVSLYELGMEVNLEVVLALCYGGLSYTPATAPESFLALQ